MCFIEHPWTERACLPVCCKKSPEAATVGCSKVYPQDEVGPKTRSGGKQHGSRGILMEYSWLHGYSWVLTGYIYIYIYINIHVYLICIYIYIYTYIYIRIAIPSSNIDPAVDGGWKTTFLFGWRAMISLRCSHSDYVAPLAMTKMTKQWHLTVWWWCTGWWL